MPPGRIPTLVYNGCDETEEPNTYISELISKVPLFQKRYKPPAVWGANGHIQTAVYSLATERPGLDLSSLHTSRHYTTLEDGTRICYDMFYPPSEDTTNEIDVTIAVCPGLANTSDNLYIKAFVAYATHHGYRLAVLNSLGVLDEELTTPRIFSFGSTEEYGAMVREVLKTYPTTNLIALGYSLGGNIVCKYLGENVEHQKPFICCISLCQGYDCNKIRHTMNRWAKLRKFYARHLTIKVKTTIIKNWQHLKDVACSTPKGDNSSNKAKPAKDDGLRKVKSCKFLPELDELVTIKLTGHASVEEYYTWASSSRYLDNIDVPTLYLNAKDDPLFSKVLLKHPVNKAKKHRRSLFVLTQHGGHLGFFTKTGSTSVDTYTWLDRMLMEYITAVVSTKSDGDVEGTGSSPLPAQQHLPSKASTPDCTADHNTALQHECLPNSWSTSLLEGSRPSRPMRRSHTYSQVETTL